MGGVLGVGFCFSIESEGVLDDDGFAFGLWSESGGGAGMFAHGRFLSGKNKGCKNTYFTYVSQSRKRIFMHPWGNN